MENRTYACLACVDTGSVSHDKPSFDSLIRLSFEEFMARLASLCLQPIMHFGGLWQRGRGLRIDVCSMFQDGSQKSQQFLSDFVCHDALGCAALLRSRCRGPLRGGPEKARQKLGSLGKAVGA